MPSHLSHLQMIAHWLTDMLRYLVSSCLPSEELGRHFNLSFTKCTHQLHSNKRFPTTCILGVFLWDDPDQDQWSKITRIIVHQKNRRILVQIGFISTFDAPWSKWSWSGSSQRKAPLECLPTNMWRHQIVETHVETSRRPHVPSYPHDVRPRLYDLTDFVCSVVLLSLLTSLKNHEVSLSLIFNTRLLVISAARLALQ